jgi:hypothetical protein
MGGGKVPVRSGGELHLRSFFILIARVGTFGLGGVATAFRGCNCSFLFSDGIWGRRLVFLGVALFQFASSAEYTLRRFLLQ